MARLPLALAFALSAMACATFAPMTVRGTLVTVQHDDHYEAPCGIRARAYKTCDDLPICCSYRIAVQDSTTGKRIEFWAFWARSASGLLGLVPLGGTATFHLHTRYLLDLQSCGVYGCPQKLEYTLDADSDVSPN